MPFKLAVASGKGGTGKTTISLFLHKYLKENICDSIELIDCDVEEPNTKLFFKNLNLEKTESVNQLIPQIDSDKCTYCKKCVEYCEFNAITVIENLKYTSVSKELCHSCGACVVACKQNAITEYKHPIGNVNILKNDYSDQLIEGRLNIGSTMQTALIRQLNRYASGLTDFIIYDAPPGTSCPVVETLSDSNYVVLVTEPTPFGLHDLKLTVSLVKDLGLPSGIVINKANLGNNEIYEYIKQNDLKLLGEIPFNKNLAQDYSNGDILNYTYKGIEPYIKVIASHIEKELLIYEGDNYFIW